MTALKALVNTNQPPSITLFESIAQDVLEKGYSVKPSALPESLTEKLYNHLAQMNEEKFKPAGIGRGNQQVKSQFVRRDEISWINGESEAGQAWLDWSAELMVYLNRRLMLGLFSFESHFAHYGPGDFYKTHLDAFRGQANRVLSLVVYLNPSWLPSDGGELVIYPPDSEDAIKVTPLMGTIVAFLSEEFPHEVLPASRDRYSIAGWFRLNTSIGNVVDPSR
jgi:SM-20-related protein